MMVYYRNLANKFKLEFNISRVDLMQLRNLIQKLLSGVNNVGYYSVILSDTMKLFDFFIDQQFSDLIGLKTMKEIIQKFESLKNDLARKISFAQRL